MKLLICGAHGFVGQSLESALRAAGHQVVRAVHHPRHPDEIACDYAQDHRPEDWLPRLRGIDVVINAVGILNESKTARFVDLHERAPIALFQACVTAEVKQVIQISALNADPAAPTAYLASKGRADAVLLALPISSYILRPSLIFGVRGGSTGFFLKLAALPIHILPGGGNQRVQPVHIDDIVAAVYTLVRASACQAPSSPKVIPAVGFSPIRYRDMLMHYRQGLGMGGAWAIPFPISWIRAWMPILTRLPQKTLSEDTLTMLTLESVGDTAPLASLLGHPPRRLPDFLTGARDWAHRLVAQMTAQCARVALSFIWMMGAVASLSLAPPENGYAILNQIGINGMGATLCLYTGAGVDALMSGLTMLRPSSKLWWTQIAIVLAYTLFLTFTLPHLWLHPFGALVKNAGILALLVGLLMSPPKENQP